MGLSNYDTTVPNKARIRTTGFSGTFYVVYMYMYIYIYTHTYSLGIFRPLYRLNLDQVVRFKGRERHPEVLNPSSLKPLHTRLDYSNGVLCVFWCVSVIRRSKE